MSKNKSQNTHYIPEWVLKKFRDPVLFELDIFTGITTRRNPMRAGSGQDLWPEDIEDQLGVYDNAAAQIFRKKIANRDSINLTEHEKLQFAKWLSQFAVRVPRIRDNLKTQLADEQSNPIITQKILEANQEYLLESARQRHPDLFKEMTDDLGKKTAESLILSSLLKKIASSGRYLPTAAQVHHTYLRNNSGDKFAEILCQYHWTWLRTQETFVIGDNPLVRWHIKTQRCNYGIRRSGVEITMPLTSNLCLRLTRTIRRDPELVKRCTPKQTRLFNERQRLAAVKFVYGCCSESLDFVYIPLNSY